jgi:hypothetical protein
MTFYESHIIKFSYIFKTQLCEDNTISFSTMQKLDKKCEYTINNGFYKFGNSFLIVMNMYFSFSIYLFYIFEFIFYVIIHVQIY